MQALEKVGSVTSPKMLLEELAPTDDDRLHWLPVIWHAVVTRRLLVDWDLPIDYGATLHLPEESR